MSEEPKSVVYYELRDTITQLRRENEIMKKALEFYASDASWEHDGENLKQYDVIDNSDLYRVGRDLIGGQRAIEALKDCEEL